MFRLSRVTVAVVLILLALLGIALLRRSFDMVAGGQSSESSEPVEVIPATPIAQGVLEDRPGGPIIGGRPAMPAELRITRPSGITVEVVAFGIDVPWDFSWSPDGRLWVNERPGRVRIIEKGKLKREPWLVLDDVHDDGEGGLLGQAVDPKFAAGEPWIYLAYTANVAGDKFVNRVIRVREEAGKPGKREILLDNLPAGIVHNGTGLTFGPDDKLYISTGDTWEKEGAQDLKYLGGKILRLNRDGSIPADNPFGPQSPVWTLGNRNPQGMAFDPFNGNMWATEHGPSGEWTGVGQYDEVNHIERGKNYGWPLIIGAAGKPDYVDPVLCFPEHGLPPNGIVIYDGRGIPEWKGNLFFCSLRGGTLVRVVLDDSTRTHPVRVERLFEHSFTHGQFGRLRALGEGPDGYLYFGTTNRDGRGKHDPENDRIFRILPAGKK